MDDPLIPDDVEQLRADLRYRLKNLPPDLQAGLRHATSLNPDLAGGTTMTWDEDQLMAVEVLFFSFEEARERFDMVVNKWGDRGDLELRAFILRATGGKTSSVYDLTAVQVDELLGSIV